MLWFKRKVNPVKTEVDPVKTEVESASVETELEEIEELLDADDIISIAKSYIKPKISSDLRASFETELKEQETERKRLSNKLDTLSTLPIERKFQREIFNQIRLIDNRCMYLKSKLIHSNLCEIDLNIFDITGGKTGYPRLAPFSLNSSVFHTDQWRNNEAGGTDIPQEIFSHFSKFNYSRHHSRRYLSVTFPGIIPDDIRAKLPAWKKEFKTVYFIADVTDQWEIHELPVGGDPFVVGYDGVCSYLLATFDLTPFEKWVKAELIV